MKKRILCLLLALGILFTLTACASPAKAPVQEATRTYTDDCGRTVEIPEKLTSVAASGPLTQIILFALAPEMLAGITVMWDESAKDIIPEKYLKLPYFGQLYSAADLNVEELAAVHPQLIIDIGKAKKSTVEDMDGLEAQTQIPSIHLETDLATTPETFRKLGVILGKEEKAEQLARFCEKVYTRTLSVMEKVEGHKVRTLYILGPDGGNVLAKNSYHSELLDLLTENLADVENPTSKGSGNAVTLEQIALWDPDFFLFAPGSIYDTVAETGTWKEFDAIRNGQYVEVPQRPDNWMGMPPSVQRYLGMIWLTSVLYPEYCDYDVKAEIREYYRLFYGCDLSDAQYDALTAKAFIQ